MIALLAVHKEIQEEDKQDRKAAGYKLNGNLAIIKQLNSFSYTIPPAYRVMPTNIINNSYQYFLNYAGIYNNEVYQLKLVITGWVNTI